MITSPDNDKLKTIRKLQQKRWREKLGLFAAEGEDLIEAAAKLRTGSPNSCSAPGQMWNPSCWTR